MARSPAQGGATDNNSTSVTLTVGTNNTSPAAVSGVISNTTASNTGILSLTKVGTGTLTLSTPASQFLGGVGYDTYSGATTLEGGTLVLDLSNAAAGPSNLLNPASPLDLVGGTLGFKDQSSSSATTQSFSNGTTINVGGSAIAVNVNGNSNAASALAFGALTRATGGTIDFGTLPSTGHITTSTSNTAMTILGGWATVGGGATWAIGGGNIAGLITYENNVFASGNDVSITANDSVGGFIINSLRFNANSGASGYTLTASGSSTIASGGILITPSVGAYASTIAGGTLTSGNGQDLVVNQYDAAAATSISAAIVNNGATVIGLTKSGPGTLVLLSSTSAYGGPTSINGGMLQAGAANIIPSTSAVVLSGAGTTFDLEGFSQSVGSLANFNASVNTQAGVNFGYGTAVVADGTATLTVGNDNTSTTYNGALRNGVGELSLVKVGGGTLTLGNYNDSISRLTPYLSNYSGGTTDHWRSDRSGGHQRHPRGVGRFDRQRRDVHLERHSQSVGSLTGEGNALRTAASRPSR